MFETIREPAKAASAPVALTYLTDAELETNDIVGCFGLDVDEDMDGM